MIRGFEPKRFSGTIFQFVPDELNLFLGNSRKGSVLWEIRMNQVINIFIEAAFPGRIGMSKKEAFLQSLSNGLLVREFFAIIRGQGVQGETKEFERSNHSGGHRVGSLLSHLPPAALRRGCQSGPVDRAIPHTLQTRDHPSRRFVEIEKVSSNTSVASRANGRRPPGDRSLPSAGCCL